jgi:hypothetical protein
LESARVDPGVVSRNGLRRPGKRWFLNRTRPVDDRNKI